MEDVDVVTDAVITGPILMGDIDDIEHADGLPYFETAKVNDLAELISAVFVPKFNTDSTFS